MKTDIENLKIMQTGEFKEKIVSLSNRLLHYAGFFLRDREDARDAVQDVLLKLWEKRKDLSAVRNLEAFAMQVTRNHCLDKVRAARTIPLKPVMVSQISDNMEENKDMTEWKDTAGIINRLVSRLPEQQRNILLMRDFEQLEYEEIAGITGMDLNNLRVNLSRARKTIREDLIKIWKHEERRSKNSLAEIF